MDTWHERGKRNLNNIDRLKETEYGIETITCMIHVIQSINQHYSKFVHLHKIATTNVQRFIVTHFVINFSTVPLMVADSINASQIPNHFLHRTFIDLQQVLSDDKIEVCIIVTQLQYSIQFVSFDVSSQQNEIICSNHERNFIVRLVYCVSGQIFGNVDINDDSRFAFCYVSMAYYTNLSQQITVEHGQNVNVFQ